ncbi:hypothetical protein JHK87_043159 [Glycine soja]|nr:hypothetical protein JHK87_043159 [Glycine soja]
MEDTWESVTRRSSEFILTGINTDIRLAPTFGNFFRLTWNLTKVTPEYITCFKDKNLNTDIKVYPRRNLFDGYSTENEDKAMLSPILSFLGGMDMLKKRRAPSHDIDHFNAYNCNQSTRDSVKVYHDASTLKFVDASDAFAFLSE